MRYLFQKLSILVISSYGLSVILETPTINTSQYRDILSYDHFYNNVIIDSDLSFEEAIEGLEIPTHIKENLDIVEVNYISFDLCIHRGQLVVHQDLKDDVKKIFDSLLCVNFPIYKVVPIVKYNWSDSLSMANNNTSCFNYRNVKGTKKLSDHSYGRAIDINPMQNPFINHRTKVPSPLNGKYDVINKGTILKDSSVVRIFKSSNWKWGGNWKYTKDYQHFYKR